MIILFRAGAQKLVADPNFKASYNWCENFLTDEKINLGKPQVNIHILHFLWFLYEGISSSILIFD